MDAARPAADHDLFKESYVMTDNITTADKKMLGERVGIPSEEERKQVSLHLKNILGL